MKIYRDPKFIDEWTRVYRLPYHNMRDTHYELVLHSVSKDYFMCVAHTQSTLVVCTFLLRISSQNLTEI